MKRNYKLKLTLLCALLTVSASALTACSEKADVSSDEVIEEMDANSNEDIEQNDLGSNEYKNLYNGLDVFVFPVTDPETEEERIYLAANPTTLYKYNQEKEITDFDLFVREEILGRFISNVPEEFRDLADYSMSMYKYESILDKTSITSRSCSVVYTDEDNNFEAQYKEIGIYDVLNDITFLYRSDIIYSNSKKIDEFSGYVVLKGEYELLIKGIYPGGFNLENKYYSLDDLRYIYNNFNNSNKLTLDD